MNQQMRRRKKAIFFLFDSLFAIVVLITGTILVFSTYVSTPNTLLTHSYAVQLLDQLHDVEVQDLSTTYLLTLRGNGSIPAGMDDKSLLQLMYYYIDRGEGVHVFPLFNETVGAVFPAQFNLEIDVNSTMLFNISHNLVTEDDARFIVVERRIFLSEFNGTLYGPNVTKVKIW